METDGSGSVRAPAVLQPELAGTESAQPEQAGTEQAGTEQAGTEQAGTEQAGTEQAAARPPSTPGTPGTPGRSGPAPAAPPDAVRRLLSRSAAAGIGLATLIMLAASAGRPGHAVTAVRPPAGAPPWWLPLHLPVQLVAPGLWTAAVIGGCGVIAGIAAVSRGARPPARMLLTAAFIATAAFTVLPPTGSTDSLDYAAYGRMVVLGHNPYVMTPYQLRRTHDPVGKAAPVEWEHYASVYGPLASAEQGAAAELGGTSALFIVFWLKLWNALAFGAVALALDRLLRRDPARRARAHLLWSVNPLLLWCLIEGGHADGLAAAVGFLGLLVLTVRPETGRTTVLRALAAGLLVGAAVDVKATLAMYGLGVAWAARKSISTLAAAAAGALAVLVPSYLAFGHAAVSALSSRRAYSSADNIYEFFARPFGYLALPHVTRVAGLVFVVAAGLLLWRLPEGNPARPAIRPALALSIAWLIAWPYEFPWYDAMAFCLLALYPVSRLDWLMLARLTGGLLISLPGLAQKITTPWILWVTHADSVLVVPVIRLAVLAGVIFLCLSARWRPDPGRLRPLT
jgi:hypothetical protein